MTSIPMRRHLPFFFLAAVLSTALGVHAGPWIETARLVHGGENGDGLSVAIDGNVAVVGELGGGFAAVFVRSGSSWTETAALVPSEGSQTDGAGGFGSSVAISGDTIVVGAPDAFVDDTEGAGKAYVFIRPATGWAGTIKESAQLGSFGGYEELGSSVSISGNTIVAGAPNSLGGVGLAYVFSEPSLGWSGTIPPSASLYVSSAEFLGTSVGISGDVVIVGSPNANSGKGGAFIWVKPAPGWAGVLTESADLIPSTPIPNAIFGSAVAIDGTTAVVGSPWAQYSGPAVAYVFEQPSAGWSGTAHETARLLPTAEKLNAPEAFFGHSVSIAGGTVVIGTPGLRVFPFSSNDGGAFIYQRPASGWSGDVGEQAKIYRIDDNARQSQFGDSVSISGNSILVGAPAESNGYAAFGASHVFEPGLNPTITAAFSPGSVLTFQPATLQFLVFNPNASGFLSDVSFADSLPSGLFVDATPNVATSCNAFMFAPPGSSLILSTGAAMMAGWACGSDVNVSSGIPGTHTTATYPVQCDQGCDGAGSNVASLLVRLRATQTRIFVQGPIRVAPGVPVEFPFEVSAERGEIAGLTGEVVVSDGEGHACRASAGADGRGSCAITFGAAGRFQMRAQYLGNLSFSGSTSPPANIFVR
jgi:hypothetical protein